MYKAEREIKGSVAFFRIRQKHLHEVCLKRIKEQVGKNRRTVGTQWNSDSLLKNTSTIHNKYVINQKLKHFDDIRFRDILDRIRMFFQHKICPFLEQGIYILR